MRGTTSLAFAALTMGSFAQAATVYLAGDSTMAKGGAGDGATDGWGQYLGKYLTLAVVNDAVGGRSARSYTREGRFTSIAATLKAGDFVIIEFGHNDGGSLTPTDDGRTDCPGTGSETCQTTYNGVAETVLTFPAYMENAAKLMQSKGATVIISSATPDNPCEGGPCTATANRFSTYAQSSAAATGSGYIDHWTYVYNLDVKLGTTATNAFYPNDHTHTSPAGADAYAQAFVKGLTCSSLSLKSYVNAAGNAVNVGNCIGGSSTPTTTAKPTTTTKATTTTAPTGGTAAHYAQCGGTGYTGPTVCASPYVCTYSNDFYSQCL